MRCRIRAITAITAALALLAGCGGTPQEREASHMKKGKQYFDSRSYKKAAIEYKVASQNMPKDPAPLYQLGLVYLAGGAVKLAVESFEKVLTLDPKHQAAQYQLALFKAGTNKLDVVEQAEGVIAAWVAGHPNDAEALATLGMAEAKLGHKSEALQHLEAAAAKDISTLKVAGVVIAVYAAKGDKDAAAEVARQLAASQPNSPEAAVLRAQVSLATRDLPDADAQISKALTLKHDFRPALQLRLRRELMNGDAGNAEETTKELSQLPEKRMWGAYARILFSEHKIEQGKVEFERVIKEHKNDPQLRDDYASTLVKAGRPRDAEAVATGTIDGNPKDVPARMIRTILEIDRGDYSDADKDIKLLKDQKALSAQLTFQESRLFAARGDTTKQGDMLTQALKQDPRLLAARLELARLLIAGGKGKNALVILDQTPAPQKKSIEYVFYRNMTLISAGNTSEARKEVEQALAVARTPGFLYQDALLRMGGNDLPGARKSLEEAFRLSPSDSATLSMLGDVMRRQGDLPKYLDMVQSAAAANPHSTVLQYAMGNLLAAKGDAAGARAAFEAAEKDGNLVDPEIEIAVMDLRAGKTDAARQRLLDLIKTHDNARARITLADIEMANNSANAVIQHYLKAIELEPNNVLAMNNLAGYLAQHEKKYEDGLFWAQKALALAPNSPVIEDTIGWILYREGKYDLALPHLDKSLRTLDRPVAHYHLAAELAKLGDTARARREYEVALKKDPKSPERQEISALFPN